jgi:hypothetical protein
MRRIERRPGRRSAPAFSRALVPSAAALALCAAASGVRADEYINEILFNPPGGDPPNEYVELRGAPGSTFAAGTYLVGIEADGGAAGGGPGDVQNVFDLSGRSFGANGFLVLLQRDHAYTTNPAANALANAGAGPGFGSGAESTVGHSGDSSATDIENASATFMLIRSPAAAPGLGDDIDAGNDGIPDAGGVFSNWTVLDSVGVLDGTTAPGDFTYGLVNFRNSDGGGAAPSGAVVDGDFTANYVGRIGGTVGSTGADWVAADVAGTAPDFRLGDTDISDPRLSAAPLNHIGGTNPVPEPAGLALFAGVALACARRRR